MKKLFLFVLLAMTMISCSQSVSSKMSRMADKVERKGSDMTGEQWENATNEFKALIEEYHTEYKSMNLDERKEANEAIGRFCKAAIKAGAENSAATVEYFANEISNAVNGLLEGVGSFLDGLGL